MKKFTAVGAYIFAGGFTIGMSKYLNVIAHLEGNNFGVDTFKKNFNIPVYVGVENWPIDKLRNKVDVIYGNPPCAAWSPAGKSHTHEQGKDNWITDDRVNCTRNLFSLLKKIKPKIWVWESVPQAFTYGREFVDGLTKEALKMGYSVTYLFTDAQYHSLPQKRVRFHMIAHKIKLNLKFPNRDRVIVSDALKNLVDNTEPPKITKLRHNLIKHTKPGGMLRKTFDEMYEHRVNVRGQVTGRPGFLYFRLRPDDVSLTLSGGCTAVHQTQHRYITPLEHAVLCGYPITYKWSGVPGAIYKQAGQGVSPVIGKYLGERFDAALRMNKKSKVKIKTVNHLLNIGIPD